MSTDDPRPAHLSKDDIAGVETRQARSGNTSGTIVSAVIAMIGVAVLIAGISTIESCAGERPPDSASAKAYAYSGMQTFVKRRLKSPGTAQFPAAGQSEHVEYIGHDQYRIQSYVDAQNGFGASIRVPFDGVVTHMGDYQYQLESIRVGDD